MILRNFAVFEGIDGTGTTTQIAALKARFAAAYPDGAAPVRFTFEPTDGEIGRLIRRALRGELSVTPDTMARLFAADRGEHIFGAGGIKESIDGGLAVFSDRYLFSSLAYQAEAGSAGLPEILNGEFPLPEYLFFFDIESDIAMDRVERRARGADAPPVEIYERRDFQRRVRARYLEVIDRFERGESGMRVIRIDATRPVEAIGEKVWSVARNLPKL